MTQFLSIKVSDFLSIFLGTGQVGGVERGSLEDFFSLGSVAVCV
jgi:hypothetical protein